MHTYLTLNLAYGSQARWSMFAYAMSDPGVRRFGVFVADYLNPFKLVNGGVHICSSSFTMSSCLPSSLQEPYAMVLSGAAA